MLRKAVIVIDKFRPGMAGQPELRFEPVRRDHHDGTRTLGQGAGQAPQKTPHAGPGIRRVPVHEETGTAAMGNEQRRLTRILLTVHGYTLQLCRPPVWLPTMGMRTG